MEQAAAGDFSGVVRVEPLAGVVPAEFQRGVRAGVLRGRVFSRAAAWWLPLGTMLATDVALNIFYYHVAPFGSYLLLNYAVYAG